MNKTIISWVQRYGPNNSYSWNPVFGCSKVSEGCRYCYAERLALNFGLSERHWSAQNAEYNVKIKPNKLDEVLSLAKKPDQPAVVFVNSVSDLFHPLVPADFINEVFRRMTDPSLEHVTFIVLTKRPESLLPWKDDSLWTPNIWMGTSIENMQVIDRLESLVANLPPWVTKFVSIEPLIGPFEKHEETIGLFWKHLDWCIVGGESGPKHRPMPHEWARGVRDICLEYSVPFYFKQSSGPRTELGTTLHHGDGTFWSWHQYPDDLTPPRQAVSHIYAGEYLPINVMQAKEVLSRDILHDAPTEDLGWP